MSAVDRRERIMRDLTGTVERRAFAATIELRSDGADLVKFTGYASTTETPYEVGDFEETIARGAFLRSLKEDPDVVLLVNHAGLPLARTKSGTLALSEDDRGLRVEADLDPSDPDVQAVLPKMRRGDLSEMSFAFRATDQSWSEDRTHRTIRAASIHRGDVSVCTMGANPATSLSLRRATESLPDLVTRAQQDLDLLRMGGRRRALSSVDRAATDVARWRSAA